MGSLPGTQSTVHLRLCCCSKLLKSQRIGDLADRKRTQLEIPVRVRDNRRAGEGVLSDMIGKPSRLRRLLAAEREIR